MKVYIDSSVALRVLFDEPAPLQEWKKIKIGFSSHLFRLECLRSIDRHRFSGELSGEEKVAYMSDLQTMTSHIGLLPLTAHVLKRAEGPFFVPIGSLDSIHLATALLWKETRGEELLFATHDQQLANAAKAHGLTVIGI